MADQSSIEWTDATWNPITGCTIMSPGCTNCYAMRMAARLEAMGQVNYAGTTRKSGRRYVWTNKVVEIDEALSRPFKWKKPKRIFVNSMSDLFQERVSEDFIVKVWNVMRDANWHHYQLLTKRPDRMVSIIRRLKLPSLPNVWLGTSVENSDYSHRVNDLSLLDSFIKFVSFEPLLGSVGNIDLRRIDWAIVGGESGPGSRPILEDWVDEIKLACDRDGTAFFFKQWGGVNKKATGREYRGQTWDEFPVELSERLGLRQ